MERNLDRLEGRMDRVEEKLRRVEETVCQLQHATQRLKDVMVQRYSGDLNGTCAGENLDRDARTEGKEIEADTVTEKEKEEKEEEEEKEEAVADDEGEEGEDVRTETPIKEGKKRKKREKSAAAKKDEGEQDREVEDRNESPVLSNAPEITKTRERFHLIDDLEQTKGLTQHVEENMIPPTFFNGLREEIRAETHLHALIDLGRRITLAQRVEERRKMREWAGFVAGWTNSGSGFGGVSPTRAVLHNWALKIIEIWPTNGNNEIRYGQGPPMAEGRNCDTTLGSLKFSLVGRQVWNFASNQTEGLQSEWVASKDGGTTVTNRNLCATAGNGGARFRWPSPKELNDRWRRNFYFLCNAPNSPNQVCQKPHLNVLLVVTGEVEGEEEIGATAQEEEVILHSWNFMLMHSVFCPETPQQTEHRDNIVRPCLVMKKTTKNRALVGKKATTIGMVAAGSNESSFTSIITWSVCFKQWDPGGSLSHLTCPLPSP